MYVYTMTTFTWHPEFVLPGGRLPGHAASSLLREAYRRAELWNRRSVSYFASGGNSYSPSGVKVLKFNLTGDQGHAASSLLRGAYRRSTFCKGGCSGNRVY